MGQIKPKKPTHKDEAFLDAGIIFTILNAKWIYGSATIYSPCSYNVL